MRLLSRHGTDWTKLLPLDSPGCGEESAEAFRYRWRSGNLKVDGSSDFNALDSRKHQHEAQLYALDVLALDGDELRDLPLYLRKTNLQRLFAHRSDGITVASFERGEIGPDLYRAACRMGLEGLVWKHRDRPYRGGGRSAGLRSKTGSISHGA